MLLGVISWIISLSCANLVSSDLGIQSGDDKLVQEVVRILLARIYEPVFSEDSHGFRTGRSCHTALDEIRQKWTATKWLINVKHQSSVKKIALQLRDGDDFVYKYRVNSEEKEVKVYKLKDLTVPPKTWEKIDLLPDTHIYERRTEILERMNAQICEYCGGEDGYFEVHHVRRLSDIKDGKEKWQKAHDRQEKKDHGVMCGMSRPPACREATILEIINI